MAEELAVARAKLEADYRLSLPSDADGYTAQIEALRRERQQLLVSEETWRGGWAGAGALR